MRSTCARRPKAWRTICTAVRSGSARFFAAALYEQGAGARSAALAQHAACTDRKAGADRRRGRGASREANRAHGRGVRRLAQGDTWSRVRAALAPMLPSAQWVKDVLRRPAPAHRIADIGIYRAPLAGGASSAQIRERFTSLDLAWATGVSARRRPTNHDRYPCAALESAYRMPRGALAGLRAAASADPTTPGSAASAAAASRSATAVRRDDS